MLSNSTRELNPLQKRQLYRCCALPIALYRFQLWYYNKAPLNYPLKSLRKMQRRVALWITGAFHTSPTMGVEAIIGLIPINLYLKKLYQRFHLQGFSLLPNHIIKSILMSVDSNKHDPHRLSLKSLTAKQKLKLQSPLIDMNNSCNEYVPLFSPFNQEFSPGNRLINSFSD